MCQQRNKWNDYRDYSESDISKLQQNLFFKTCGFTLTKDTRFYSIVPLLIEDKHLKLTKLIYYRKERIEVLLDTLERSIQEMTGDSSMTAAEKFNGF